MIAHNLIQAIRQFYHHTKLGPAKNLKEKYFKELRVESFTHLRSDDLRIAVEKLD